MADGFVQVKMDAVATQKALRGVAAEQFPYAYAKALTETAILAQKAVRQVTRDKFNLHTEYIPRGVFVEYAKKSDFMKYRSASSAVFTSNKISPFMAWHERGGIKYPQGQKLTVPGVGLTEKSESYWKTATGRVKASFKPRNLLNKRTPEKGGGKRGKLSKRPFIIPGRGSKPAMIVRRIGKGPRALQILYTFQPKAKINATWRFEPTVRKVADRVFTGTFNRLFNAAIASIPST